MNNGNYKKLSPEEVEFILWDYIDGSIDPQERSVVDTLISNNIMWKEKYKELLDVNQILQSAELDEPSMRFNKKVMEEIAKLQIAPATSTYINNKIVFGIGGFFITVILSFVIYGISQVNWSAASDPSSYPGKNFSNIDYSSIFNNNFVNFFMMLNIVLGLMLLDRYLNSRRKGWSS